MARRPLIIQPPEPPEDPWDVAMRELIKEENERTPTTISLARDIAMNREGLKAVEQDIHNKLESRLEIDKEMERIQAELYKRLEELRGLRDDINAELKELRAEKDRISNNIRNLERSLQLELDKVRQSLGFKKAVTEYDLRTEDCEWRGKAKKHQLEGGQFMAMSSSILADKMGLGKTLTCLIAADMAGVKRLLIICQGDITNNFAREVERWAPQRGIVNLYKVGREQRNATLDVLQMMGDAYTVLVNYDIWRKDKVIIDKLINMGFEAMIIDEGHNIKDASTSAYKGVRDIRMAENVCPKCNSLKLEQFTVPNNAIKYWRCSEKTCDWRSNDLNFKYKIEDRRSVKRVWFATGTPILNKPQELYTALSLIIPGVFESEKRFLEIYCRQHYSGYWMWKPGGEQALQEHLGGRYLMRDRTTLEREGIFLPKQQVIVHEIDLDVEKYPLQARIIRQLAKHAEMILDSGRKLTAIHTLQLLTWQRQANVWPAGIKMKDEDGNIVFEVGEEVRESHKVDKVVEDLDEWFTEGRRSVVFSQFTGPLREIKRQLDQRGINAIVYDGSTPQSIRTQVAIDFDRTHCDRDDYVKQWDVVLANYRTGGVGLNFTSATCTAIIDEEWNPGKNEQAWGRTDRLGQTEENFVHIYRLKCPGFSVDTWIAKLNDFKRKVVSGFEAASLDMQEEFLKGIRESNN